MNSDTELFASRVSLLVDMAGGNSEFARKCDVSEGVVRKWKNGESDPSRTRLVTIANAMNVSVNWLATGEDPMCQPDSVTEKPNGYQVATRAPSSPDSDAYCYIPLYDVYASAGHGALIDGEQVIDKLPFKQEWLRGEMGLNPDDCCLINVTGDSMEPLLHKKDVVMLDRSQTHVIEDGIYCLRLDGSLLIKRIQRVMGQKLKVISDNSAYEAFELDNVDTEDQQIIGRVVWVGKSL
ncbi:helix-turn-helix transcriptional regulator [Methylomonas sp. EFPC1]|uniref:XRE family transcriptional regulator n=1 Tax=Methylomonas sp. EFPC1 TaxID=2812647 RepID=UPI00196773AF|nr:helix-turn-helix transcriptional regulator [Methylomonas sp. EFPC1]QSB02678.1 helix-turn-helix transcriptional regulator [Methylomonas sp. EFPC1]